MKNVFAENKLKSLYTFTQQVGKKTKGRKKTKGKKTYKRRGRKLIRNMKGATRILLALIAFAGTSFEKRYSVSIDDFFMSEYERHTTAVLNDFRDSKKCGETIEIEAYDPPYLYVSISGDNYDNIKGIVYAKYLL